MWTGWFNFPLGNGKGGCVCVCEENAENTSPQILDSLTDGVDTAPEQLVSRAAASSATSLSLTHVKQK